MYPARQAKDVTKENCCNNFHTGKDDICLTEIQVNLTKKTLLIKVVASFKYYQRVSSNYNANKNSILYRPNCTTLNNQFNK